MTYSMKNTAIGTATNRPHTPSVCSAKTRTPRANSGCSFKCAAAKKNQ
jgi:hypothetical protein